MENEEKRLSVANIIDEEDRVTVLEGKVPEEHSGTITYPELVDLNDRITVLEGGTPSDNGLSLTELLYFEDRIEELEEKQDDVTLTYNINGGTGSIDPVTVDAGTEVTLDSGSSITAPEHQVFVGWGDTDSTLPEDKLPAKITMTANKTVYAIYQGEPVTLTYDLNGGSGTVPAETTTYGASITLNDGSEITAPSGKEFFGWGETSSATQSEKLPASITLTEDKTIYAIYKTSAVVLTLDYNGALTADGQTAEYKSGPAPYTFVDNMGQYAENHFMDLNTPITENVNVFKAFTSTKNDLSTAVSFTSPGYTINEDTTLYAYWDNTHAWFQFWDNNNTGIRLTFQGEEEMPSMMFKELSSNGSQVPSLTVTTGSTSEDNFYIAYGDMWNAVPLSTFNNAHPGFYNSGTFDFSVLGSQFKNISIFTRSVSR